MTEPTAAIEARDLAKDYAMGPALDGVSFRVEAGEVCGLIGQNGAGKTTLLRILATILPPTRGTAWIGGVPLRGGATTIRRNIGYMPDSFGTYEELRVDAYLEFFAHVYRLAPSRVEGTIDDILDLVELRQLRNATISRLSLGARQRLGLARTLLHNPDVLLLDEPVSGLDPRARVEMRSLLEELGKMGKAILISSHILADLADICDRLLILERGRIVFLGTLDELRERLGGDRRVAVAVEGDGAELRAFLEQHSGVRSARTNGNGVELSLEDDKASVADLGAALFTAGFRVTRLVERELDLEEAFLRLIREES